MGTLPPIYRHAEWRNTTPCDENDGRMGVGFDLPDGSVIRLSISQDSASMLASSLDDFLQLDGVRSHLPSSLFFCPVRLQETTGNNHVSSFR